jgi:hypothetical protein
MDERRDNGSVRTRRSGRNHAQFAPILWIAVLLLSWLAIVQWKVLPDLVNATMAALP